MIQGTFYEILRRLRRYALVAFALMTVIPVLVFCFLFVHLYSLADPAPYHAPGLFVIAFLGLLIAVLGLPWMRKKAGSALVDLRRRIEEVARIDPAEDEILSRYGEVGRIAMALNRVVAELREDRRKLKELNEELEGRVRERTAEAGRLSIVVESLGESVIMTDLENTITYVNPAGCRMLGYASEEMTGRESTDFFGGIPGNPPDLYGMMKSGSPGGAWDGEVLNRRKSGEIFPVYLRTFYLCDEEGRRVGHAGVARDITKAKALREQILKSEKLAALGKLVSGIAHELNNPLTGVLGYSQIILETLEDGTLKDDIRKVYNEARRCERIVRKLRAFGRGYRMRVSALDINDLVREVARLKLHRIRDRGIELEIDLPEDVPPIDGDSVRLQQVLDALFDNAIQAIEGRDEKRLRVATSKGDDFIRIKVIDTGCGITEDNISMVFDPFFSTREVGEGAGLGLSLAYGVVREHGGDISVESRPGEGSTFTVSLPARVLA
ncbi:MAG: ATP-binding protein [Candidatus Tritonobacter lacicola]|nr:ATP-binding protein [Candidatus Tritonobacter lacicola]